MPWTAMRKRILVVDAAPSTQSTLLQLLGSMDYDAVPALDGSAAIARIRRESFDLCMTDVKLPGPDIPQIDGYAILKEAEQHHPAIPVLMLRADATFSDAVSTVHAGADNNKPKPNQPAPDQEVHRR